MRATPLSSGEINIRSETFLQPTFGRVYRDSFAVQELL
jgi:hypothetical protein